MSIHHNIITLENNFFDKLDKFLIDETEEDLKSELRTNPEPWTIGNVLSDLEEKLRTKSAGQKIIGETGIKF